MFFSRFGDRKKISVFEMVYLWLHSGSLVCCDRPAPFILPSFPRASKLCPLLLRSSARARTTTGCLCPRERASWLLVLTWQLGPGTER